MSAKKYISLVIALAFFGQLFAASAWAKAGRSSRAVAGSTGIRSARGFTRSFSSGVTRAISPGGFTRGHIGGTTRIGTSRMTSRYQPRIGRRGVRQPNIVHRRGLRRPGVSRQRNLKRRPSITRQRRLRRRPSVSRQRRLRRRPSVSPWRRFRRRFAVGYFRRPHFYYFSLPYFTYYYCAPPYFYSVPYRSYYYDYSYDEREQPKRTAGETAKLAKLARVNRHLENVAEAFAAGDYAKAVLRASKAVDAEPDNAVLFFVYSQSLFAAAEYDEAASILREALRKVDVQEQGVFYSMGFYPDEDVLAEQIDRLGKAVEAEPYRANLQLLLGYELLGVGRYDEALEALQKAEQNYVNKEAAVLLIAVLEEARQLESREAPVEEQTNGIDQEHRDLLLKKPELFD